MITQKKQYERPLIRNLNSGLMNKFGKCTEWAPVSDIDGVAVKELIA